MKRKLIAGSFGDSRRWKKYGTAIFLMLFVYAAAVKAEAAVLFQDNFDDGNTAGWSFIGSYPGFWNASGGVLHHGGGYDSSQSIALITGISTPTIFTLEADVSVKSNIFSRPDWGHVGLAWGVSTIPLNYNTSYLRTHQDRVTNWSTPYTGDELYLNTPGTTNGPTYHLRVDVNSPARSITVTLDTFTTTFTGADFDAINKNSVGGIGLMSWNDDVTWDNVRLSSPVPLPGALWFMGPGLLGLIGVRRKMRN